jgi:hypothetical protein
MLGISLNQAAAYLAVLLFHLQIMYYLVIVFVFTLIFSLSAKNLSKAVIYAIASTIIGAAITLGILLTPSIAVEFDVNYIMDVYFYYVAKLLILSLTVGVPSAIIGGIVSEL